MNYVRETIPHMNSKKLFIFYIENTFVLYAYTNTLHMYGNGLIFWPLWFLMVLSFRSSRGQMNGLKKGCAHAKTIARKMKDKAR